MSSRTQASERGAVVPTVATEFNEHFRSARDRLQAVKRHISEIEYWLMLFMFAEAERIQHGKPVNP